MSCLYRGLFGVLIAFLLTTPSITTSILAAESHVDRVTRANEGSVGVISGGIGGTYIRIATDLAAVLDTKDDAELSLRILPIAGKGSVQNINDILYLKGIDIGIVQSDVLAYIQRENLHGAIERRIHYVTKLYNEEFHLIARDEFRTIEELAGKNVNFDVQGSGTHMTASIVFDSLGINVTPTAYDQQLAFEKLKAGEISAMVYVAGKPAQVFKDVTPEDGLRLVEIPYTEKLQEAYLPSSFDSDDYKGLVPPGETVDTVAVGAVMAVFNWEPGTWRYGKVERFIDTFFSRFAEFQQRPRHEKWMEVNLFAELPGWTRFRAAADWLDSHPQVAQTGAPQGDLKETFQAFLEQQNQGSVQLSDEQRNQLFQQFLQWQSTQVQ
jgi:TRAP transporter TAXI family solute receptor